MTISDAAIRWVAMNRAAGLDDLSQCRVVVVKPRDFGAFCDAVEHHYREILAELEAEGVTVG